MPRRWAKIALIVCLWAFMGLVLSVEIYFNRRVTEPATVSFLHIAAPQYQRAALWMLLAPAILWLRRRIPLHTGNWWGGVSLHAALSFLLMAAYYLGRILFHVLRECDSCSLMEFWTVAQKSFFGRNLVDMAFYWAVLAYGYVTELQQRYKQEEVKAAQLESQLAQTELKALKQQLHPHFLFNTMNTIAVLVREKKNDEAVQLLANLSALLRALLDHSRVQEVPLRTELDFLTRYVEIQQARFSDRLRFRVGIPPEVLDARIPNLLLQPLVENAILHGVATKAEPVTVEVTGRLVEGSLQLEVRDDGPGFATHGPNRVKEGIGLTNTRERLARLYGDRHRITVQSEPGRGAAITIVLPYRP
ncbi:MAG: histidine kinase [Opitutae bacterium]|nr:histidine kinase [Opitutae bacterium]